MTQLSDSPRADEVLAARNAASLTQSIAAELVHVSTRSWVHYEGDTRKMPAASWELFLLKTKQHPSLKLR